MAGLPGCASPQNITRWRTEMMRQYAFSSAIVGLLVITAAAVPPWLSAQSVADYANAVRAMERSEGCESIPDSNLRNTCNSLKPDVERSCKEEAWSCERSRLATKALREQIAGRETNLSQLRTQ